nr:MAG TPA: hypothetical protein [Caudoviricetes sp.]
MHKVSYLVLISVASAINTKKKLRDSGSLSFIRKN